MPENQPDTKGSKDKSHSDVRVVVSKDDDDPPEKRSKLQSILLVATCTLAMMTNTSNSISIAIALPVMEAELNIPQVQLQWIVSAYTLSSGCLLVLFGRLCDLYGRKRMYILGSTWLVAFTLGCAFAKDSLTLNILRGFQGVGAAATIPAAIGTLAEAFPASRARAIAFSTFSAGAPIGATLGTVVGGILTQVTPASWKASFYLNCVLTFISVIGAVFSFDKDKPSRESDRRVDWIGAFMVTAGLTLIVFVLGQGEVASQKWATPYIIGTLVAGVVLTILFGLWQHYLEHVQDGLRVPSPYLPSPPPLMRLSFWRRSKGRVTVVMIIAFLNWASFLGWNFWTVLYYQNFAGLGPVGTVIRLLPMFVTGIICNVIVASFVGRVPLVVLITAGTAFTGTASLFFAIINPDAPYWAFGFPSAIFCVFGADFVFASGTLFIATVSAQYEQSVAGAVFQEMTQIGSSAGVTVSTVVFNRVLSELAATRGLQITDSTGRDLPRDIQLRAYQAAEWTNFAFGMVATVLAVTFLSSVGVLGKKGHEPESKVLQSDLEQESNAALSYERRTNMASFSSLQTHQDSNIQVPITFPWSQLTSGKNGSIYRACDIPSSNNSCIGTSPSIRQYYSAP
ncbi:putative efflux transporter [Dendrothele bispora CBS 962.96]|uniref:Putative efflux transporter n=1 Tax=Dendrothele bispora (strain CBS 962.96) TaxID=1314807 RepID=A0A4V4HC94_DENBC|nr:putative efflux transporter [Dendrothele bispora CBS 962.96]